MSNSRDAYLVLAGLLFAIGSFGFLARRNAIGMLMSIEIMLNGVNLSIVAFGAFIPALAAAAFMAALTSSAVTSVWSRATRSVADPSGVGEPGTPVAQRCSDLLVQETRTTE